MHQSECVSTPIYLDYHATTPVDPRVASLVLHHMTNEFGNAHSVDHVFGDAAASAIDVAAGRVGALVGAEGSQVLFTSGATESINLAIQGFAAVRRKAGPLRIAVSPTEHVAVLDTCSALARVGAATIHVLHVDSHARVDRDEIESQCRQGLDLLCVMAANNEVGTIAPIDDVGTIASRYGVAYLCDATQACGRIALDARRSKITFLVLSGHKIHAPKGVGALVLLSRRLVSPIIHGGEHQHGLRAGTLNVPGIAGLGFACQLRGMEMAIDEPAIQVRRDRLQQLLIGGLPGVVQVNGDQSSRLAGNLHTSFLGCPSGAIVARVRDRLAVATGAACSSGIEAPSHVLRAMELADPVLDGAIRIGVGKWTTDSDIDCAADLLMTAAREALAAGAVSI
jgi:cysteine desulfurase